VSQKFAEAYGGVDGISGYTIRHASVCVKK